MRTNVVLDNKLIAEAFKYSDAKTKKELIHIALKEFINIKRKKNLLDLAGKIEFADSYDYTKIREKQ